MAPRTEKLGQSVRVPGRQILLITKEYWLHYRPMPMMSFFRSWASLGVEHGWRAFGHQEDVAGYIFPKRPCYYTSYPSLTMWCCHSSIKGQGSTFSLFEWGQIFVTMVTSRENDPMWFRGYVIKVYIFCLALFLSLGILALGTQSPRCDQSQAAT